MAAVTLIIVAFLFTFGLSGIIDIRCRDKWPNAGIIFAISFSFAILFALVFLTS
ncbi:MAG: hypothetical protein IJ457_00365 [Clostridia bacterium]|nr:hypothetical protein [Clostridia bacterium]